MNWFSCSSVLPDAELNVLVGWTGDGDFATGYYDGEGWRCVYTAMRFHPQPDVWCEVEVPSVVPGVIPGQMDLGVAA